MEICKVCGSERKICKNCGAELHKRLDDFIVRSEIIYAIFMAWGFAAAAETLIKAQSWSHLPLLVIAGLVLMRFFFAPTKNLYAAALTTEHNHKWRWLVFLFDFPILIFHSFSYYSMCLAIAYTDNYYRFYQWFIILLSINVIWLISLALRVRLLEHKKNFMTFIKWSTNNSVAVGLSMAVLWISTGSFSAFGSMFFTKHLPFVISPGSQLGWALFAIALFNCCLDLFLTASDYLGFS